MITNIDKDLMYAVNNNSYTLASTCLQMGADPNLCYGNGQSLLYRAATKENLPLVHLLLDYGADSYDIVSQQGHDTWSVFGYSNIPQNMISFINGYYYGSHQPDIIVEEIIYYDDPTVIDIIEYY